MIDIMLYRILIGVFVQRFRWKITCGEQQFCFKLAILGIVGVVVRKILIYLQVFKN